MRSFIILLIISIFALAYEKYKGEKPPEERELDNELSDWFVNEHGQIFEFNNYGKEHTEKN